ncbi:MAG: alpha/beta hydrolase [Spirosomataceae bacterium]
MKKLFLLALVLLTIAFAQAQTKTAVPYGNNPKAGKYFATRGIKLYYEIYGKGKPLLLIHGNGGSMAHFKYQIPYFAQQYKVIAVDSRAQGKSVDSSSTLTYETMTDDFDALLTHLKIDSAYVIGWSDGGINGLLLAIRHPDKVKKLAVTGANLTPDPGVFHPDALKSIQDGIATLKAGKQDAEAKNTIKLLHMMEIEPNILLSDLKKIKCPVLVIGGDYDAIKAGHTLQIFENIPKAYLWILPNAGHATLQRYKDEFNSKIQHFFKNPFRLPKWDDWDQ